MRRPSIECHKVNPPSDCDHIVGGRDENELMANAQARAREHGLKPTPELMEQVHSFIEEGP